MSRGLDPIDAVIGGRIKRRRILVGMSQECLGDLVGVSFQQIQKYERGTNRVAGSMFAKLARALNCPCATFFEGVEQGDSAVIETPLSSEALRLAVRFDGVRDPYLRELMARTLSAFEKPVRAEMADA